MERTILIKHPYLKFPVCFRGTNVTLRIYLKDDLLYEFDVPVYQGATYPAFPEAASRDSGLQEIPGPVEDPCGISRQSDDRGISRQSDDIIEIADHTEDTCLFGSDPRDFMGVLPVKKHIGETLRICGDADEGFFDHIIQEESDTECNDHSRRVEAAAAPGISEADTALSAGNVHVAPPHCPRPFIHFTPKVGWMNDPNGLYYDGERWQLYFQHNPFGKPWGNMTWGHAYSTDLLHWKQADNVLHPDALGTMFSGSALIDSRDTLGCGKTAVAYFYTTMGRPDSWVSGHAGVQCLAVSTDGGFTLEKQGMILDMLAPGNRDPKVYYYEPGGHYYMVLYLTEDEFAIYVSEDLKAWTLTDRFRVAGCMECPDLREIPCEEGGGRWCFMAADGYYVFGDFDGKHFRQEGPVKHAFSSVIPYAAQTFYTGQTDRVIQIPWLRTADPMKPYTSAMGLPRELTVRETADGPMLIQREVREYLEARQRVFGNDDAETCISGMVEAPGAYELRIQAKPGSEADRLPAFRVRFFDTELSFDEKTQCLVISGLADTGTADPRLLNKKEEKDAFDPACPNMRTIVCGPDLREAALLLDESIAELTLNDGEKVWIFERQSGQSCGRIYIETDGECEMRVYSLPAQDHEEAVHRQEES